MFDTLAELHYTATYTGNIMSRATWHAAERRGGHLHILDAGPAHEAVQALYGGPQGQAEMTRMVGTNIVVGGEAYISWRARNDEWDVFRSGAITRTSDDKPQVDLSGDGKYVYTNNDLLIRIWQPHPGDARRADSPSRSSMTTMRQLAAYDQHISTQLISRLAGNGLLLLPDEIDFPADPEGDPAATTADGIIKKLWEAASAAIADRTSPAAHVPLVMTMPGELITNARWITFWSELDNSVTDMREAAVRRLARSLDIPEDVLVGTQEANHWNAYFSDEIGIKVHIEPRLGLMAHGLTTHYLRPALTGTEVDVENFFVVADTSPIRARPNRSAEALELNDRGLLKASVTLAESGFNADDQMDGDEYRKWLLQRIATGAVTPELTAEALRLLGAQIDSERITDTTPQLQPGQTRTDTEVERPDWMGEPSQADYDRRARQRAEDSLVAACEVLTFRALERVGNKLKNHHKLHGVAVRPETLYMNYDGDADKLLAGVWDCAETTLGQYDCDVHETVAVLDFYVRGLLNTQRPFSRDTLARLIRAEQVIEV